jgi:hypothetical protein
MNMEGEKTAPALGKASSLVALALFLATVTVNALANILPINGVGTGQLSDELPNLFVPAGLTFSVWGLIYLLLAGYSIACIVLAFRKDGSIRWDATDGAIFSLNMAANIAWIFAWQYRHVAVSLVIMFIILGTLIWLEERNAARLRAGKPDASPASRTARYLLSTPINVYLGWICVATIANVTALLVKYSWNGFGLDPRAWTVAVIAVGLILGLLFVFLRDAVAAPLVIVWAYAGIAIKRTQVDMDYSRIVWISAIIAAGALLAAVGARLVAKGRKA